MAYCTLVGKVNKSEFEVGQIVNISHGGGGRDYTKRCRLLRKRPGGVGLWDFEYIYNCDVRISWCGERWIFPLSALEQLAEVAE